MLHYPMNRHTHGTVCTLPLATAPWLQDSVLFVETRFFFLTHFGPRPLYHLGLW